MPQAADTGIAHRAAVLDDIADDVDERFAWHLILLLRHFLQRPEAAAEGDLSVRLQMLIPEQEYPVRIQQRAQGGDRRVGHGTGRIEADDLHPEHR